MVVSYNVPADGIFVCSECVCRLQPSSACEVAADWRGGVKVWVGRLCREHHAITILQGNQLSAVIVVQVSEYLDSGVLVWS